MDVSECVINVISDSAIQLSLWGSAIPHATEWLVYVLPRIASICFFSIFFDHFSPFYWLFFESERFSWTCMMPCTWYGLYYLYWQGMEQVPQGSGHGPELLELRGFLGTALRYRVWVWVVLCGSRGGTLFQLGYSIWDVCIGNRMFLALRSAGTVILLIVSYYPCRIETSFLFFLSSNTLLFNV